MAKAKDLAALAGLAGLAYAMRNKDKSNEDAGDQKTSSYTKDTKKVEATDEPFKATHGSSYTPGNAGTARLGVGNATNDPIVKPPKVVPAKPAAADEPAGFATPVSSANRTDQLTNLSRAVKREDKTKKAAQADFSDSMQRTFTIGGKPDVETQKLYDAVDKKSGATHNASALKTDAMKVASRAAAAADRQRKMAKQSSYKSGGMTASSRADGIASRGKTKCKMY
jgi:hypothetical protein